MALAPGEVFEHTHLGESITVLLSGSVDLVIGTTRTPLVVGAPTRIPAKVSHTLVNTGTETAMTECMHKQGEPPAT